MYFLLIIFEISTLFLNANATEEPPFCQICDCELVYELYNVICMQENEQYLFDKFYWQWSGHADPYRSLTIINTPISELNDKFPESDIVSIVMTNCSIEYVNEGVFSYLEKLEDLVLSHNNIEAMHPQAFTGRYTKNGYSFLNIKQLLLDHNRIHSLRPDLFKYCPDITKLSLAHNPLETLSIRTIKALHKLKHLKKLDLSYTQLSVLPTSFLEENKNLKQLDLSGNKFLAMPTVLSNFPALNILHFSNNPLDVLSKENVANLTNLKILHMSNMPNLTEIKEGALGGFFKLEEVYITNNTHLGSIHKDAFLWQNEYKQSWPKIKKLDLSNNKLSSIDMELLLEWDILKDVDLSDNPWNCECSNRWMIEDLTPNILLKRDRDKGGSLRCASPNILQSMKFVQILEEKKMQTCWTFHLELLYTVHYVWPKNMGLISYQTVYL